MASQPQTTSLRTVKGHDALCELPRDHWDIGDWCIMTDGIRVWLSKQALGENRTAHIEVPKNVFDKLLTKYEKPMTPRKKRSR